MDSQLKNRLLLAFIAFNVVFMAYQFGFNSHGAIGGFLMAFLAGGVAAGAVYGVMAALKL